MTRDGFAFLRLADQEMNVIGHRIPPERSRRWWARQPRLAMITTARDETQLIRAVAASGMVGHKARSLVPAKKTVTADLPVPTFTKNGSASQEFVTG